MRNLLTVTMTALLLVAALAFGVQADETEKGGTVVVFDNGVDSTIATMISDNHDWPKRQVNVSALDTMPHIDLTYDCIVQVGPVESKLDSHEVDEDKIVRLIGQTRYETNDLALDAALDPDFGC